MSTAIEYAEMLESGRIPDELSLLQTLGSEIKSNPEKYKELRTSLLNANSESERISLLKGFAVSESQMRRMYTSGANDNQVRNPLIIPIIIIATLIGCPGSLH